MFLEISVIEKKYWPLTTTTTTKAVIVKGCKVFFSIEKKKIFQENSFIHSH